MPRLYDWLVTGLNETNLCITEAIGHADFSLVDRQRLRNWQGKFYEQIEQAREILLPGSNPKTPTRKKGKTEPEDRAVIDEASELALKNAVLEWQKKYGIRDGDLLLASLELFHIYLHDSSVGGPARVSAPGIRGFPCDGRIARPALERVLQASRRANPGTENRSRYRRRLRAYQASALLLTFIGAFVSGLVIGKFLL